MIPLTKQTVNAVFKEAKKILEGPDAWARKCLATDMYGNEVGVTSPKACKFCAQGAIDKATLNLYPEIVRTHVFDLLTLHAADLLADHILVKYNFISIPEFNDAQKDVGPVLDIFDIAIRDTAEGEGDGSR